ncbi:MAG: hypothetical protein WCW40_07895 [Bacteroidota bacterium]
MSGTEDFGFQFAVRAGEREVRIQTYGENEVEATKLMIHQCQWGNK